MDVTKKEIEARGMPNGKRETDNEKRENKKMETKQRMCDVVTDRDKV